MTNTNKSIYLTLQGYIITSLASLIIYPAFGIPIVISTALQLGVIFTIIAFISNYIGLRVIAKFENKHNSCVKERRETNELV